MTRAIVSMAIDDALHYTPEQRASIVASYPAHEREARKGHPTLGSGRIFPVEEESILVEQFLIPAHWPRINGIDFGWDHPAAAVQAAWDRDADCWYVIKAHRAREQTPFCSPLQSRHGARGCRAPGLTTACSTTKGAGKGSRSSTQTQG